MIGQYLSQVRPIGGEVIVYTIRNTGITIVETEVSIRQELEKNAHA